LPDVSESPLSPGGRGGGGERGGWGSEGGGWGPLCAGLLAGLLWALTPIAVDLGQTLMSDEPTALVCLLSLCLTGAAFLRRRTRGDWELALAGGLAFGLAATMRSIVAVLMLAPVAAFVLGGFRRKPLLPRLLAWGLGAALFPAVTMLILARSGWPIWQWSGYGFWMPGRYERLTDTFGLRYAFQPDLTFRQEVQGRPLSHLELALRVLLGIPGLRTHHYLGYLWPIAGWLAAVPLYRIARRRDPQAAGWTALGLLLWTLGHAVVFSLYFYPSSRFYLAPLALCLVLFATACGVGLAGPDRRIRLASGAAAVLIALSVVSGFVALQHEPPPNVETERTRVRFAKWLAKGDEWRSQRTMPFDPVHAQALGLLTPEVAAQVHAWGSLPDTVHVRRLRANGYLAAHVDAGPGRK
jgi:4-amino-4-deoxy-L-arabinose transferase-like glycosyltransferase